MAMTIGEAGAVATVLHALAGDRPVDGDALAVSLRLLNERAAAPLQLSKIMLDPTPLDAAAVRLTQPKENTA